MHYNQPSSGAAPHSGTQSQPIPAVLEAIIQWCCHHKLDAVVNAAINTFTDLGLDLSNETEARYGVLQLKQKIIAFSYNASGEELLDVLESFVEFVSDSG